MFSLYFSSIFEPMRYSFRRVLFFTSHSSSISHNSEDLKLLNQRLNIFIDGVRVNNVVLKRRWDESLGINASKFTTESCLVAMSFMKSSRQPVDINFSAANATGKSIALSLQDFRSSWFKIHESGNKSIIQVANRRQQ